MRCHLCSTHIPVSWAYKSNKASTLFTLFQPYRRTYYFHVSSFLFHAKPYCPLTSSHTRVQRCWAQVFKTNRFSLQRSHTHRKAQNRRTGIHATFLFLRTDCRRDPYQLVQESIPKGLKRTDRKGLLYTA